MKKFLSSLVVLAILVGMFVCLGTQALAAEGDAAIFAVSGTQLTTDNIGVMQEQCPDCLVVDVDGLSDGQSATGYNVVYVPSDPGVMTDYAVIWPGTAQMFYVGTESRLVVLVAVDAGTAAEDIAAAVKAYTDSEPDAYAIAMGPADAGQAVMESGAVSMFLTYGLDESAAAEKASNMGGVNVVSVAQKSEQPVSLILVDDEGSASAQAIPVPAPVQDAQTQEPQTQESQPQPEEPQPTEVPAPTEEPITYYDVIYDGNGKDEGTHVPDDHGIAAGSTYSLKENGYTKQGYEFQGWTINSTEEGTPVYQPGDPITVNENITVYAKWEQAAVKTYTLTYAPGEGVTGDNKSETYPEENAVVPVKDIQSDWGWSVPEGKQFAGWKDADGYVYQANEPCNLPNYGTEEVVLTAQWADKAPVVQVTITFDANGGSGAMDPSVIDVDTAHANDDGTTGMYFGVPECGFTAPENKIFAGWLCSVDDQTYKPGPNEAQLLLKGDQTAITMTAQWADSGENIPTAQPDTEKFTVTFKSGVDGIEDVVKTEIDPGTTIKLDLPETFKSETLDFTGWVLENDSTDWAIGDEYPVVGSVVFTATTAPKQMTLTYKPGEGATGTETTQQAAYGSKVTLKTIEETGFQAPSGKKFSNWTINGYDVTGEYEVLGNVDVVAKWVDMDAITPQREGADMLIWNNGGNDQLTLKFTNASVATVSVGGTQLSGEQYSLSADKKVITFNTGTSYEVKVTFENDPSGAAVTEFTTSLEVKSQATPEPTATPAAMPDFYTWADRSSGLQLTFDKTPNGLAIDYTSEFKSANKDKDYTISGNSITLLPDLINKNWGGEWPNDSYGFRVYFTDGSYEYIKVMLSGAAPAAASDTASPSPTNNPGGGAPVTGDDTPIVMYIVILAVLIVALAVVLIIVMKRRNAGNTRGRH